MIGLGRPLRSRLHTSGTCRYPSLRYNQDAVYVHVPIFYARLTTPSGTAQLTRLQQVPIVTCCAPKRHRCLIPSLPSNQPIQFSLTLNIINTSSHHHITPLPRIHTCSMYTKGSSQNPDPTDRPMHLTCSIEKYTHHPYSTSLHPSTHPSIIHPSIPHKHLCKLYVPAQHHCKRRPPPESFPDTLSSPRFFFPLPSGRSWAG